MGGMRENNKIDVSSSSFSSVLSFLLSRCETKSQGKRIGYASVDGQQDQ